MLIIGLLLVFSCLHCLIFYINAYQIMSIESRSGNLFTDEETYKSIERIENYSKWIFANEYRHHQDIHQNRSKRDFGIGVATAAVTGIIGRLRRLRKDTADDAGSIIEAVVDGIIGMTAKAVSDITAYRPLPSNGGCMWFGSAPFCNQHCPADYDFIRSSNGRCSNFWFAGICKPDPSFGHACSNLFGHYFRKNFCCKSDPSQCSWSGRWMGASTAHNIYCRYDNDVGRCGSLDCAVNYFEYQAQNSTEIFGKHCDQINLFGRYGKATCGYIAWFGDTGDIVDSWYKTK